MCKNFEGNNTHIKSLVFLLMCKDFERMDSFISLSVSAINGVQIFTKVYKFSRKRAV